MAEALQGFFDQLTADVANLPNVTDGTKGLLHGIKNKLDEALAVAKERGASSEMLHSFTELITKLESNISHFADAVQSNTPSDPHPVPKPRPTQEPTPVPVAPTPKPIQQGA